jgi:hypothetical protein
MKVRTKASGVDITPNKWYNVLRDVDDRCQLLEIEDDTGCRIVIRVRCCAHIGKRAWEVEHE